MPSPAAGRNTSKTKFPPRLVSDIETRAGRLGLKENIYLSILLHNFLAEPTSFKLRVGRARMGNEKRVPVPLSLPLKLRSIGAACAKDLGSTFTALLEELATRDIAKGGGLLILESDE